MFNVARCYLFERAAFVSGRRQAGEVKRRASQESQGVGGWTGDHLLCFESSEDKVVDWLPWPGRIMHCRNSNVLWNRNEGPMLGEFCALSNPPAQQLLLVWGEGQLGFGRRHPLLVIRAKNAAHQLAF